MQSQGTAAREAGMAGAPEKADDELPLVVVGAVKRFRKRTVLAGVDLDVGPGDGVWIGGRNGVGKTTLLRLAAGFFAPDDGFVSVFGTSHERERRRTQMRIGFLSAGDRGLYARLTVRQHLQLWAKLALMPPAGIAAAVTRTAHLFELEGELIDRRVDRMSMGQRQRLRLALTFLHSPKLVLIDEPLTSLDGPGAALLARALGDVRGDGGAVVWCSPDPESPEFALDRPYVIEDGGLHPA
jgi:ABC-type multidrug transport system ATPase subunit